MPKSAERGIRPHYRLSQADEALILKLASDGRSQTDIAQIIPCDQSTVSRLLSQYQDTRFLAKQRLHNSALALSERVIHKASVEESLEVLDRLDVIAKRERSSATHGAVQIFVGMPGKPAHEPPAIDLSPVPRLKLPEESTG